VTNDDDIESIMMEEFSYLEDARVQHSDPLRVAKPAAQPPIASSHELFGQPSDPSGELNLEALVNLRRQHQTKQAERGVCTRRKATPSTPNTSTLKTEIFKAMLQLLRQYVEDGRGVGTGIERSVRWKGLLAAGLGGLLEPTGNSANAALAAKGVTQKVCTTPFALLFKTKSYHHS
jgi:hypothetical protein